MMSDCDGTHPTPKENVVTCLHSKQLLYCDSKKKTVRKGLKPHKCVEMTKITQIITKLKLLNTNIFQHKNQNTLSVVFEDDA
jgi:hypothetical protein